MPTSLTLLKFGFKVKLEFANILDLVKQSGFKAKVEFASILDMFFIKTSGFKVKLAFASNLDLVEKALQGESGICQHH